MSQTRAVVATVFLAFVLSSCGGNSSPASPSPVPTPTPTPTTFILSGTVASTTGPVIPGATVRIADGPNAGRSTVTNNNGSYSFATLTASSFTLNASAPYYVAKGQGVTVTSNQTANVELVPIPVFTRSGSGDTVFDLPSTVSRIRIQAAYTGNSSNFVVYIGGRLIVNELLGRGWNMTTFDGTYLTGGGVTEIKLSSGVSWTFTEVR